MRMIAAPTPPSSLKSVTILGMLSVLFGVFGFLFWALFTPLDSAVVAQGVVKVSSEKKQVQHLEGGIVKKLLVKEGDDVQEGQVLLLLDETFAGTDYQMLTQQIKELMLRQARLEAQRDRKETIDVPEEIEQELESNEWLRSQYDADIALYDISQKTLENKLSVLSSQISQLKKKSWGDELELKAKKDQIAFMEEEIASWSKLLEQKYANKLRYLEIQGEHAELKGEEARLLTAIASAQSKLEELQFEKEQVTQSYREVAANELVEVRSRIKDLTKQLDSASNVLGRVEIRAPVSGKVVGLNVYTLGGVIKPGETIMEIVPEKDELVVGAKVRPIDIDKVYTNMNARIRLSSYKQHEFPEFYGLVEFVSADTFQNEQTLESYYTAQITIDGASLPGEVNDKIHPGMPAEVLIVTGESTPAQYLMEPLMSAFRSAWRDS